MDGTPESFEFQLPYSLAIREKSLANIDVVCVPNSIMTVIPGVNDLLYLTERSQIGQVWQRTPRIAPGYYNVESLREAIQAALSEGSNFPTGSNVVDRHSTSWDSFDISPNTTIGGFTVQLTDYNGNVVDLNGQNWSFSISIYRDDI